MLSAESPSPGGNAGPLLGDGTDDLKEGYDNRLEIRDRFPDLLSCIIIGVRWYRGGILSSTVATLYHVVTPSCTLISEDLQVLPYSHALPDACGTSLTLSPVGSSIRLGFDTRVLPDPSKAVAALFAKFC